MDSTTNILLLLGWFILTASVIAWLITRANAQIRRYRDEPTSKKQHQQHGTLIDEMDTEVLSLKRKVAALDLAQEDIKDRIVSLGNRVAAQKTRDKKADLEAMMDQLVKQQSGDDENGGDQQLPFPDQPPTVAVTENGQTVDFR